MKIYLGLDIGDVRIGVAKSTPILMMSQSYEVINRNKIDPFNRIKEIIKEEKITDLVVGLPINKNGEKAIQVEKIEKFINKLNINIPIHYIDERYTTKEAEYYLKNFSKKNAKQKKEVVDMIAAQIILQNFLDKQKRI